MPPILTLEEAAQELRLTPAQVLRLIEQERLPALELDGAWRIRRADLEECFITAPRSATSRMTRPLAAGAALLLLVGAGVAAMRSVDAFELGADESARQVNGVPGVLPFEGVYERDQMPYTGTVNMVFRLSDASSGGVSLWESSARAVEVVEGRFAVVLGDAMDASSIPASVFAQSALYLELVVEGEALSPRQRIAPAPQAVSAAQSAADFTVNGDLDVQGTATIDTLDVGRKMTVTGPMDVSGPVVLGDANMPLATVNRGNFFTRRRVIIPQNPGYAQYRVSETSVNGTFCGETTPTNGSVSFTPTGTTTALFGHEATKAWCEETCSSRTAHMCDASEIYTSKMVGIRIRNMLAWYNTNTANFYRISPTLLYHFRDCLGWESSFDSVVTGEKEYGSYVRREGTLGNLGCDSMIPIACCD